MRTRIQKWGNSLAVRIPRPFAQDIQFTENLPVEITVRGGKLVVAPIVQPELSLSELVAAITPKNRHDETSTGGPVGNEVW